MLLHAGHAPAMHRGYASAGSWLHPAHCNTLHAPCAASHDGGHVFGAVPVCGAHNHGVRARGHALQSKDALEAP